MKWTELRASSFELRTQHFVGVVEERRGSTAMYNFRKLAVWRKAHDLALAVYRETRAFPQSELFGLTSQLRRGATSIPSNVAEGCGRGTDADFKRFLQMAIASANELEYQLLLSHELNYLGADAYESTSALCVEVRRMLISLQQRLSRTL